MLKGSRHRKNDDTSGACATCVAMTKVLFDFPDPAWRRGEWICRKALEAKRYTNDMPGQPWVMTCDDYKERPYVSGPRPTRSECVPQITEQEARDLFIPKPKKRKKAATTT